MAAGPLRSRIRRILKLDDDPMLISGKSFALVLGGLILSATLAVLYVPSIGQANESATETTESTEKKGEKNKEQATNYSTPEPALIPFEFVLKPGDSGKSKLYMNDQPVGEDVVRNVISSQGKYVSKLHVSLSAEKGIAYADVMKVIDLLESLGVKKLALDTRHVEASDAQFKALFTEREDNPIQTRTHDVHPSIRKTLPDTFEGWQKDPFGPQVEFKAKWNADHSQVEITAPKAAQYIFAVELKAGDPAAKGQKASQDTTVANASQSTKDDEEQLATFRNFEAKLKTIKFVVVLFNDTGEYRSALGKAYAELVPAHHSLYVYGIRLKPTSAEAKRYGLTGSPACIVFRDGKEAARLEKIKSTEELHRFVLATIGDHSSKDAARTSKFPSLEDQKLADLAWKRLGLELEPIGEEDLKRVKALGYEGGVKVVSGSAGVQGLNERVQANDLLVGLHAWPTTSMKEVAKILDRDDLDELNPLKFYVVRNEQTGPPTAKNPNEATFHNVVLTGRLNVNLGGGGFGRGTREHHPSALAPTLHLPTPTLHPQGTTPAAPRPATSDEFIPGSQPAPNPYIPRVTIAPPTSPQILRPAAPYPTPAPIERQATPLLTAPQASQPPIAAPFLPNAWPIGTLPALPGEPPPPLDQSRAHPLFLAIFSDPNFQEPMSTFANQLQELKRQYSGVLDGAVVNVQTDARSAESYNVKQVPTYILYHKRKEITRLVGQQTTEELQAALQKANIRHESTSAPSPTATIDDDLFQSATPKRDTKTTAPQSTIIAPNAEQLTVADRYVAPSSANTPSPAPADPTQSPVTRRRRGVTLTPAESVFIAYDIPPELKNTALRYFSKSDVRNMADDRGRHIVQAPRTWHDHFAALLKVTPKWRDPAAAKERAAAPVTMKKIDGEDILEWRSVGLSFKRNTENRNFVPPSQVVAVAEVAPGSPAAWDDIRVGDVLTEVGSFNAGTMTEVQSLLKALGEGLQSKKGVRVTFVRQGPFGMDMVTADFTLGPEDLGAKPAEPHDSKPAASTEARPAHVGKADFLYDGRTFGQWRTVWYSDSASSQKLKALDALEAFAEAGLQREIRDVIAYGIYSENLAVAQRTRQFLRSLSKSDAAPIVDQLIKGLKSELGPDTRIKALRGLASIGPNAAAALPELEQLLAKDSPERIAAATAIKMMVGKDRYQKPIADALGEELGIKVIETGGVWAALPRDNVADVDAFNKFTEDVIREQELLFPPEAPKRAK